MASATIPALRAPFPYFGGKRMVASLVWSRLGADANNYVEPFAGSLAVLLGRPTPFGGVETVNDACGFLANFWRAVAADPEAVARFADNPVNENDLHARHAWLVARADDLAARLEGDPDYFDAKIAGWWCWGLCCWIGHGWCSGKGPWGVVEGEDGARRLERVGKGGGINRKLPHLGDLGRGVNQPRLRGGLVDWFAALAGRLRDVRVACGDWSRVVGPSVLFPSRNLASARTAVFLDPPYSSAAGRDDNLYRRESGDVARAVREWAVAHGDDPRLRIALCGYEGEHEMPGSWECVAGKSGSGHGYGGQSRDGYGNARRERIWFSPHCRRPGADAGPSLFAGGAS